MTVHHLIPNASPNANRFSKTRRTFLDPIANPKNNPHFEKPPITNNVNLTLPGGHGTMSTGVPSDSPEGMAITLTSSTPPGTTRDLSMALLRRCKPCS